MMMCPVPSAFVASHSYCPASSRLLSLISRRGPLEVTLWLTELLLASDLEGIGPIVTLFQAYEITGGFAFAVRLTTRVSPSITSNFSRLFTRNSGLSVQRKEAFSFRILVLKEQESRNKHNVYFQKKNINIKRIVRYSNYFETLLMKSYINGLLGYFRCTQYY